MITPVPTVARVRWMCRRGTQELDRLLGEFAEQHYERLDDDTKRLFVALLQTEDDRLWDYFIGKDAPSNEAIGRLVERIRTSR